MTKTINIHSIFESISGEAGFFPQGTWCTFVRFQGCNLRCEWCDTPWAQDEEGINGITGRMTIDQIIMHCKNKHVLITGGEPLFQEKGLTSLIYKLTKQGHKVQVETNGSYYIPTRPRACWVVDYKCISSGMSGHMHYVYNMTKNLMETKSVVKFVIDPDYKTHAGILPDLEQAVSAMNEMKRRGYKRKFIISPKDGRREVVLELAKRMATHTSLLNDVVFSVQLHKLIDMP